MEHLGTFQFWNAVQNRATIYQSNRLRVPLNKVQMNLLAYHFSIPIHYSQIKPRGKNQWTRYIIAQNCKRRIAENDAH